MDWLLIIVIVAAFLIGYAALSYVIRKLNLKLPDADSPPASPTVAKSPGSGDSAQSWFEDDSHLSWPLDNNPEEIQHARVLGLSGKVTPSAVKRLYGERLAECSGHQLDDINPDFKRANQDRSRQIAAAYQYLCRKYGIN